MVRKLSDEPGRPGFFGRAARFVYSVTRLREHTFFYDTDHGRYSVTIDERRDLGIKRAEDQATLDDTEEAITLRDRRIGEILRSYA